MDGERNGRPRDVPLGAIHDKGEIAGPTSTLRSALGRMSWGVADQAVSSVTNFAVGAVVARSLGLADFGIFALIWATYGMMLNISRGLATDPLMVRFNSVEPALWRQAVRHTAGTSIVLGVLGGVPSVIGGAVVGGPVGGAFVALGVTLPALLLQDSWRYAFFAASQAQKAFANDLVWALAMVPAMLFAAQFRSVSAFVLAWGMSAGVATVFGSRQTKLVPSLRGVTRWFRQHRDLGMRYLAQNVCLSGTGHLQMYGLGAIAGLAAVGGVRGAQLSLGPVLAIFMGLSFMAIPEAARSLHHSIRRLSHFCIVLGGAQSIAALAWGFGLLFLVPDSAGAYVLGSVWPPASMLILPVTLAIVFGCVTAGAGAGLRALGAAPRSLRAQIFDSITHLTFGLIGAVVDGALGSCWGVVLAAMLSPIVWWTQLRAAMRDHQHDLRNRPMAIGSHSPRERS